MHTNKLLPHMILASLLLMIALILNAAETGQIKGIVTDSQTGNPIISASVFIVGTSISAQTDFEGKYIISNVEPGKYQLRVTHIDYQSVTFQDVEIQADLSTVQNASLTKKEFELNSKILVTDDREIIDQLKTTQEEIAHKPVSTADMSLQKVIGKVTGQSGEVSIRGNRDKKIKFYGGTVLAEHTLGFPPAHGGSAIVNGEPFDAMFFENYGTNPFVDVEDDSLSTFAIDVDDASYIMSRSYLERGHLPPKDAVRTEEFINHFDYSYDAPSGRTFDFFIESAPSHFGQNSYLLKVGIKGREIRPENRKVANLVFVVDVSGSMARENRLILVKKALRLLVDELGDSDQVGIVVYGSIGRVILEPTSIKDKEKIITAIEMLHSGGATFAEQGIRLGYEMADRVFDPEKINRIILCSDGVANVGRTGADAILKQIKTYAKKGITLSSIGFGMGNYNDVLLEKLGNKGNGYYAYVDDINEAKRIFVDNLTGTLEVIARDVKIQMEFNGKIVRSYRLFGYENRDVADKDFRNDDVDGGEVGSGHEVTALYEIKLTHAKVNAPLGKLYIRYKDPVDNEIYEISKEISCSVTYSEFKDASENFKLSACAAEFAEILRDSYWAKEATLSDLKDVVKELYADSESSDILELLSLIDKANELKQQRAEN